jgi:hypothetical protein
MNQESRTNRFSQAKVEQHKQLAYQLQKANTLAVQAIIRIDRLSPLDSDFVPVCRELTRVVHSISLLIACCKNILDNDRRPTYSRINLIIGKVCEYCLANGREGSEPDDQGDYLEADPAWKIQVENALSLTTLAMCRVLERKSFSSGLMQKYLESLADLNQALSQQELHLHEIGSWRRTQIRVISDDSQVCRHCGHSFESGMEQESMVK